MADRKPAKDPTRRPILDLRFYRELVSAAESTGLPLAVREAFAEEAMTLRGQIRELSELLSHREECPACGRAAGLTADQHRTLAAATRALNTTLQRLGVTKLGSSDGPDLGADFTA